MLVHRASHLHGQCSCLNQLVHTRCSHIAFPQLLDLAIVCFQGSCLNQLVLWTVCLTDPLTCAIDARR